MVYDKNEVCENEVYKNVRNTFLNNAESIIRKSGLSDKVICTVLRIIHFVIPVITIILLIIGTKELFLIIIVFNIIVFILFFLFDGCILSRLEHCFTEDKFTVIDPFLMLCGIELTNKNRTTYSIYSSILGFIATYVIYVVRFGKGRHEVKEMKTTL
jgi:hypothetical protein